MIIKRILISLWGLLYGIIGSWWGLLGVAFTFPESSPGSKDYEEDRFFIPLGVIMILFYLIGLIISYYKLRKSKPHIIIFSASLLIGIIIFILLLLNHML